MAKKKNPDEPAANVPGFWVCGCGGVNPDANTSCHRCGR